MKAPLQIAFGGEWRLWEAIEEQVRREFEAKLQAVAYDHWETVKVEREIQKEVQKRFKQVASPHSLYAGTP